MIDIKAIREAAESTPTPWPMSLQPNTVITLCDEIERLRKDAARYQWLKDRATASHVQHYKLDYPTTWHIVTGGSDTNIDAAIDAAMESK